MHIDAGKRSKAVTVVAALEKDNGKRWTICYQRRVWIF